MIASIKKPLCIVPGCQSESISRGLCPKCYTSARYLIRDKKTDWATLESLGLAQCQRDRGVSKLLQAFNAAAEAATSTATAGSTPKRKAMKS